MEKENSMRKKLILLVCMMTLMAFAFAAPGAFAKLSGVRTGVLQHQAGDPGGGQCAT